MPNRAIGQWAGGQMDFAAKLRELANQASASGGGTAAGGRDAQPGSWLCQHVDCHFAVRRLRNWPDRAMCVGCLRPKSAAMRPPVASRVKGSPESAARPSGPSAMDTAKKEKEDKKREARSRKREARRQQATPVDAREAEASLGPVAAAMAAAEAPPAPARGVALPAALLESIPMLRPSALEAITASLAKESGATAASDAKSPETLRDEHIGNKGPTAKGARKAELEADASRLRSALAALGTEPSLGEVAKGIQAKLDAANAELSKLAKAAPSIGHRRLGVKDARSSYALKAQARKDREASGAAKAAERRRQRQQSIDDLKAQVDLLENGLKEVESKNLDEHAKRAAAAADTDAKVFELFDKMLAELGDEEDQPMEQQKDQPKADQASIAEDSAMMELSAAREQIKQLQGLLEAAANSAEREFGRAFDDIVPSQLPKAQAPKGAEAAAMGALYQALQAWSAMGAASPFDWRAMAVVTGDGMQPTDMAKKLLGDIWTRWYATDPAPTMVVPRQVAMLMLHCLSGVKIEHESQEASQVVATRAAEGFRELQASAKRLRTSDVTK